MHTKSNILGIDIGSVSISAAEINPEKEIIRTVYTFHNGNITENIKKVLNSFDLSKICRIASTSSTPDLKFTKQYDNQISIITAVNHFHDKPGAILFVGGEKFGLIQFDKNGNYLNFRENSGCAAGTGSFLDQQSRRLNLSGIDELSEIAFRNKGSIPKIASRCAVFAKTDLVHAQQEGYLIEEICDGLCYGLAKNIVDILFIGEKVNSPIIFTGGVSKNRAVVSHIQSITGMKIITDKTSAYGAIGAAFCLLDESDADEPVIPARIQIRSADDILINQPVAKKYFYKPLQLEFTDYPDFSSLEKYEYTCKGSTLSYKVEVDIYETLKPLQQIEAYLGIDIGSTSTKAVLMNSSRTILAGFYTRTAGRPAKAVQRLFESIDNMVTNKVIDLKITGTGTTGSGRKFIGKLIGADLVIDEITAHARAAIELMPDIDTIIEIGGQDSKFTTLKNGMVTFSIMNNVCAAGTGSFIEEQAEKLGCPLSEYSSRTENQKAPIASDRCTVFMERDINHYLARGYSVNEALASVLHSVRENYLTKVAVENYIGNFICFQGATARNRALAAAFEQRLGKPIYVSEYCHLTGAMGTALTLLDQEVTVSEFRGIGLYEKNIPVKSETCDLCTNHCKLTTADIEGETVAYGFLCGRDYNTKKYVNNNLSGFDLLRQRKKVFSFSSESFENPKALKNRFQDDQRLTFGIPAALHLFEDIPFWKNFFNRFPIKIITSEGYKDAVKAGKHSAGAEFCAPMTALHGHVQYLKNKADFIFLPVYLEKKTNEKNIRRQYCYYTQFSSALASCPDNSGSSPLFLMPLVNYIYTSFHTKIQLYKMLKSVLKTRVSFFDVSSAYDKALEFKNSCLLELKEIYKKESEKTDDIHAVLLGRPYTVLDKSMNKGIPDFFASLGIKVFFQDMLSYTDRNENSLKPLFDELHWYYASEILKAAQKIAQTEKAYPVFITSFKCSPDSFVIDYFKKLMESHEKPYLILQMDEHLSRGGYETRIEAAIRSFKNHHSRKAKQTPVRYPSALIPAKETKLTDKIFILPNWDDITLKLVTAILKKEGIDTRLIKDNDTSIKKGLRLNTGQCIPLNIIAQGFIDYVETHNLDPAKTVLWAPLSTLACNLGIFPHHFKSILHSYGNGMEKAGIYSCFLSFMDVSLKLPVKMYFAHMLGGIIRRAGCRIRPYEKNRGKTDEVIKKCTSILYDRFRNNGSLENAVAEAASHFENIERYNGQKRPKVAIFGDLYARDNDIINQDLIHFIEDHGGEVITTPYSSYSKMIAGPYMRKWFVEGKYIDVLSTKALIAGIQRQESIYYRYFEKILNEPEPVYNESPEKILSEYNIKIENTGESMDNIIKIFYLMKHHPDISLFVQTSPAFCCPSLVTEAMAKQIEKKIDVPIVSITYDGIGGNKNNAIIPYLRYTRKSLSDLELLRAAAG